VKKLLPFLFFLSTTICFGQNKTIDSLSRVLKTAGDDSTKIRALNQLSIAYEAFKPDSAILLLQKSLYLSRRISEEIGEYKFEKYALFQMAYLFSSISNYPKALENYIELLKLAEREENPKDIASANFNIATTLAKEKEYSKALAYFKIADSIIDKNSLTDLKYESLGNIGDIYYKLNNLDSALYLTMKGYEKAVESYKKFDAKNTPSSTLQFNAQPIGILLNNLGNIYSKLGNTPAALKNYSEALLYSEKADDADNICEINLGLAKLYEKSGDGINAILCANKVIVLAEKNDIESRKQEVFDFLKSYYKNAGKLDSAFTYQEKMIVVKDSIEGKDRIKQSLNITIEEELRQQEKRDILKKEQEQIDKTLQLLGVGMLIPSFFLFTIFIRRRKIKPQIIKFCGVVSLLMLFECLTLILHPYVVEISHHIVVVELLIFVGIAAIVIPTHHKIEHWLLSKLTEHKNAAHRKGTNVQH
jgi:tetratricopeptide (TPR) repeat protein